MNDLKGGREIQVFLNILARAFDMVNFLRFTWLWVIGPYILHSIHIFGCIVEWRWNLGLHDWACSLPAPPLSLHPMLARLGLWACGFQSPSVFPECIPRIGPLHPLNGPFSFYCLLIIFPNYFALISSC